MQLKMYGLNHIAQETVRNKTGTRVGVCLVKGPACMYADKGVRVP